MNLSLVGIIIVNFILSIIKTRYPIYYSLYIFWFHNLNVVGRVITCFYNFICNTHISYLYNLKKIYVWLTGIKWIPHSIFNFCSVLLISLCSILKYEYCKWKEKYLYNRIEVFLRWKIIRNTSLYSWQILLCFDKFIILFICDIPTEALIFVIWYLNPWHKNHNPCSFIFISLSCIFIYSK